MKSIRFSKQLMFLAFFLLVSSAKMEGFTSKSDFRFEALINTISGQVWDPYNKPVSDLYVELINENFSTVARQRTSAGRFVFTGMSEGKYKVKVLTTGTDYLEQTQEAQVINLDRRSRSDNVYVDFRLRFDPNKIVTGSGGAPEEIFVQDGISDESRKLYRKGVQMLSDGKDRGLNEIEQSLQISPNYFDALNRLGTEYVKRKEYEKAVQYLIKAIDINQRSYSSFYALGYAAYKMNQISEAVKAARAATTIKPAIVNGQWLYGTVLRLNGDYEKAEKALLQAKKLTKNPLPEIHWQLALLYNRLGRNKEAVTELEYYLKIQPDLPEKKEVQSLIDKLRSKSE